MQRVEDCGIAETAIALNSNEKSMKTPHQLDKYDVVFIGLIWDVVYVKSIDA